MTRLGTRGGRALLATALLLAAGLVAASGASASSARTPSPCAPHPPIEITERKGPQGFVLGHEPATGELVYRPGSGVVAGQGTAEDPFVIPHWCLTGSTEPSPEGAPVHELRPALAIEDTRAHVVVRGVFVAGSLDWGIVVDGAENVTVEESTVRDGIRLHEASNVTIERNRVSDSGWSGIQADFSAGTLVRGNEVFDNHHGILLRGSSDNVVTDNRLYGNTQGSTDDLKLALALKTIWTSEDVHTPDDNRIAHNVLYDNQQAILADDGGGNVVEANEVRDNRWGIRAGTGATVNHNNVHDHRYEGLAGVQETDARWNWWGCPEGPGSPGCDDVEGDPLVDPWLTEPNPEAGPREAHALG